MFHINFHLDISGVMTSNGIQTVHGAAGAALDVFSSICRNVGLLRGVSGVLGGTFLHYFYLCKVPALTVGIRLR